MARIPASPQAAPADRLGLALFMAGTLHAILILGLSFDPGDKDDSEQRLMPMEITLVHSRSDQAPEKADYLAQATQKGGGNIKEKVRPASPFPNPRPTVEEGTAAHTRPLMVPPPEPRRRPELLTRERDSALLNETNPREPRPEVPDVPHAAQLVERSLEIARLSAEIRQQQQIYAQMPREVFVSANTKEVSFAAYQDAWRLKVERIGTLNYPDEARRHGLSGSLILDVALNADGSLRDVRILRSSGRKVLDDGAIRIVRLAAPFAPFPEAVRREYDVMHIVRTWQFEGDDQIQTR